jgi:hypothetical protein
VKTEQVNRLLALAQIGELVGVPGEPLRSLPGRERLNAADVRAIEDHAGAVAAALVKAYDAALAGEEVVTDRSQAQSPDEAFRNWLFRPRVQGLSGRGR